jgi:AAA15 family ATPase/GTPase
MLIDFTIQNFRSIKEPVTLSLLAADISDHPDNQFPSSREPDINLLKTAVIYGANASGKSNIINAFNAVQDFIVKSTDLKLGEKIKYYQPFKLEKGWDKKPAIFEIEFIAEDAVRYRYEIAYNHDEILKEHLLFYPKGQEANLFLREKDKPIKFGNNFYGPAKTVEKHLLENNLFLSKAANNNNKLLKAVYLYFRNTLRLSHPMPALSIFTDFTTRECLKNESVINKDVISEFLKIADTGIEYMDIKKRMISEKEFPFLDSMQKEVKKEIIEEMMHVPQMFHKVFEDKKESGMTGFDLGDESDGTIKLYELAGEIFYVLKNGLVLIADELNSSLHPLMTQAIIKLFHQPETNPKNAQLIFATHDTTLLNPDMLRRDQIWLTEKDQYGMTSLYSVSEFYYRSVQASTPFDKWYLSGRFGALPIIGRLEQWIKNAQKETDR